MTNRLETKEMHIRFPMREYEALIKACSISGCRSLNEYARKTLAGKPISIFYRDKALDEFLQEAILLRRRFEELIANAIMTEEDSRLIIQKIEEIKENINKIFDHVCKNWMSKGLPSDPGIQ